MRTIENKSIAQAVRRARALERGVTLVEVLIVVAIMAMLAGGVAFAVLPRFKDTQLKTAKNGALEIRKVSQLWQTENSGDCPSLSQLKKDGFLDRAGGTDDPWGKPFKIKCENGEVIVTSYGPDKKRSTNDDIVVPAGGSEDDE